MGGHAAGDVASATVIEAIQPFDVAAGSPSQLTTVLGNAIRAANDLLAARSGAEPGAPGMGSTLTALLWSGGHVAVANIGDSRVYLLRNGTLRQITEDYVMSKLVAVLRHRRSAGTLYGSSMGGLDGLPICHCGSRVPVTGT